MNLQDMQSSALRLLLPPAFDDPERTRRAALVHGVTGLAALLGPPAAIQGLQGPGSEIRPFLLGLLGVAGLAANLLNRSGRAVPAALLFAAVAFVVVSAGVLHVGGVRSMPFLGLILLLVFAASTLGELASWVLGASAAAVLVWAYRAEAAGSVDFARDSLSAGQALGVRTAGVLVFLALLTTWTRQHRRALVEVREREAELQVAHAERLELQEFNQRVLDSLLSVVYISDVETGVPVYVNPEFTKQTGYTAQALRDMSVDEMRALIHDDDRAKVDAARQSMRAAPDRKVEPMELRYRSTNDEWRTWLVRDAPFRRNARGEVVQNILSGLDITELQQARDEVQTLQTFNERILELSANSISIFTLGKSCPAYVSPEFVRSTGFTMDDLRELSTADVEQLVHEDDRAALDEAIARLCDGDGAGNVEFRHRCKGGGWIPLVAQVAPFRRDPHGALTQVVVSSMDVSELKRAQQVAEASREALEQRNEQLQRANAELEQFVYIASHDLQEPVRTVRNFVNLLAGRYDQELDETGRRSLQYLSEASDRMRDLIRSLLDFSRLGLDAEIEQVDLGVVLDDVLADLGLQIEQTGATISRGPLPTVPGRPAQLRSLFQNLLGNALKFTAPDVRPHVEITATDRDHEWHFAVSDNGLGIDPGYHERVFEIFQQLEPGRVGGGTGIGLAHCKKIVELHGGRIWIESEMGTGTTFKFALPQRRKDDC